MRDGNERAIACKTDWDIEEMPAKRKQFKIERNFTREELQNLRYGHIPQEMDDRWFMYMEGDTLYVHRSWSGTCIFIVELNTDTGVHKVSVNRDKKQYDNKDIKEDIEMVQQLLDDWAREDESGGNE